MNIKDILSNSVNTVDGSNPLSYAAISNAMYEFRRSGTWNSKWNATDNTGHFFFKILFHFNNDMEAGSYVNTGLLIPSWSNNKNVLSSSFYNDTVNKLMTAQNSDSDSDFESLNTSEWNTQDNSAFNFLMRNGEVERADMLKKFIELLSNISSYSPWYFMEIAGLDGVMEKPIKPSEPYKIEDPKQITLKCMPDAVDTRIGTLVDLYKSVVYSHIWDKFILPVNLRKFDMSVFIFESPVANLHFSGNDADVMNDITNGRYSPAFKCIELRGCEFDFNISKSSYVTLNNSEGFQQLYEIPIYVDEVYEKRYNPFISSVIGDVVSQDFVRSNVDKSRNSHIDTQYNPIQTKTTSDGKSMIDAGKTETTKVTETLPTAGTPTTTTNKKSNTKDNRYPPDVHNTKTDNTITSRLEKYKNGKINYFSMTDQLTGGIASEMTSKLLLGNIYKGSISDVFDNVDRLSQNIQNANIAGIKNNVQSLYKTATNWYTPSLSSGRVSLYNDSISRRTVERDMKNNKLY